ncbi:MAG: lamin tail domain-containing protein, partial [Phycisphaerae bacterium]|nr:lamin tail domain-containing protein [Phycisphaerae bacterium]
DNSQAVVYEDIEIPMNLLLDGENVLALHGLNAAADPADFLIQPKLVAIGDSSTPRHFAQATPGATNTEEWWRNVEDTVFDHDRGFYTDPFDLVISTSTPDAQIYYTTNGTKPLMSNGTIHVDAVEYTAPINITTTTTVRAVAIKATYAPTNVDTHTYLFLDDVINQSSSPAGFPAAWGGTTADYEMDTEVTQNPIYQNQMQSALQSIPTMSIVMDMDEMFGGGGIYTNSGGRGVGWERETSLEYFDPNSSDEFQIDAGLRIYGGAFRGMGLTRKKSFRVLFKGDYGATKLNFPLFDAEDAATSFDNIVLRAGANDGWNNWGKANTQYIIDEYMRRLQLDLDEPSGHGTFVNLYINGLYWGLYNPIERPEASFCATYFGGEKEDWDAMNSGDPTGDSNKITWDAMLAQVRSGPITDASYQKIQGNNPDGTRNPAYDDLLDVENYIAYMFSNIWGGTGDWPGHNWYAAGQRPPDGDGWKFFNWDAEGAIVVWSNVGANRTGVNNSAAEPYAWLRGNDEFNMLFGDLAHKWMFNGGPATQTESYNRYSNLAYEIEAAVVGESARWGDQSGTLYTQANWVNTRNNVLYEYMPQRPTNVLNQLKAADLYPDTEAPVFQISGVYRHGGEVTFGDAFSMASGNGSIYYTTDGTDPRATGGAIDGTLYSGGNITLTDTKRFRARRYYNGEWSALNDATFYINPAAPGDMAITEINYNPYAPTNDELLSQAPEDPDFTAGDFEFIELFNKGGHAIDVLDVEFTQGVEVVIPAGQTILNPGDYGLLVADLAAFEARYGTGLNVLGVFGGSLDNSGELLKMESSVTGTFEEFEYNDSGSWPNRADGGGSTLELIDQASYPGIGSNWRSSSEYGGSPGVAGIGPRSDIVINEVLTHSDDPFTDAIELHNTTGAPIDISGWFLSDSSDDYAKFEIPAGTVLGDGEYIVFYEGHFVDHAMIVDFATEFGGPGEKDFALNGSRGDDVWLVEADSSGKLLSF